MEFIMSVATANTGHAPQSVNKARGYKLTSPIGRIYVRNHCLLAKLIRLWMGRCPKPCSSPERRGTEKRWFYVRI